MLYEVMKHCRNFFPAKEYHGKWIFSASNFDNPPSDLKGRFILVEGSLFNDGVHDLNEPDFDAENFCGYITVLAPPKAFLDLVAEIKEWKTLRDANVKKTGPYQSESFGGYSYSRATNSNGGTINWTEEFSTRLNVWRKL